jgi:hypothetical protein
VHRIQPVVTSSTDSIKNAPPAAAAPAAAGNPQTNTQEVCQRKKLNYKNFEDLIHLLFK